jgi:hypothetical protein
MRRIIEMLAKIEAKLDADMKVWREEMVTM